MHPILFQIGPVTIYSYGFLFAAGVLLAVFLAQYGLCPVTLAREDVTDVFVWTAASGIIGARLAYVIEQFDYYRTAPLEVLYIWEGGLTFHGGMIASLLFLWMYACIRKISFLALTDFCVPYIALAHAAGRAGCFLNGCCYGLPFDGPWAVHFPELPHPVHPTQLYEAVPNVFLFFLLVRIERTKKGPGITTAIYFLLYGFLRFMIEYVRGDKAHDLFLHTTETQWVMVAFMMLSASAFIMLRRKYRP